MKNIFVAVLAAVLTTVLYMKYIHHDNCPPAPPPAVTIFAPRS